MREKWYNFDADLLGKRYILKALGQAFLSISGWEWTRRDNDGPPIGKFTLPLKTKCLKIRHSENKYDKTFTIQRRDYTEVANTP